jgi:hypothetical protein
MLWGGVLRLLVCYTRVSMAVQWATDIARPEMISLSLSWAIIPINHDDATVCP